MKPLFIFLIAPFLSYSSLAQNIPTKRELKKYIKIYGASLNIFFDSTPKCFVLSDSTDNRRITEFNLHEYASDSKLDKSWIEFLITAESTKSSLHKFKIKRPKSIHTIILTNIDTLNKALIENYQIGKGFANVYPGANGWVTISSPILSDSKNKAIVEVSYTRSPLDGKGFIILLEKTKTGKWIVIRKIKTWVA